MKEETMQIVVGDIERLYHVQIYALEGGLNCYRVYRKKPDDDQIHPSTVYCTVTETLEKARLMTTAFLVGQLKQSIELEECRQENLKLKYKMYELHEQMEDIMTKIENRNDGSEL